MRAADCIVDIGPGAGEHGGEAGGDGNSGRDLMQNPEFHHRAVSVAAELKIPVPNERRKPTGWLKVRRSNRAQSEKYQCGFPAGCHDLRDRCFRFGKELSGQ